jgi:two-component system, OmpR family, phosphate regulon sensor histidine kinase PhoR
LTGGVRSTLLVASVCLVLVAGLVSTVYLRAELRDTVESRIETELIRHARTARIGLEGLPVVDGEVGAAAARRFSEATGTRIEVLTGDGRVLADSAGEPSTGALTSPEVAAALDPTRGQGLGRRGGWLFAAVPFDRPDARGVVRVSAPRDDVEKAYDHLYVLLSVAGVVGLAVSVLMTWLATHLMSRALNRLAAGARHMARGEGRQRIVVDSSDELGDLGTSLNRMADDVERTLASLSRERVMLGSVLEAMSQGVVAIDGNRRITLMNEAATAQLGLPAAPLGAAFIDHVRVPALVELVQPPFRAGVGEVQMPAGIRLVARVSPTRTGDDAILILQDVTSMRRLETIRRDFVANVSHELRTPVSIIRANAETLLSGALDDPRFSKRMVDAIHRNAERLSRILADLLDLSRLEAGQFRTELGPVRVRPAIEQARASVETAAAAKEIEIEIEVADDLVGQADAKALDQILVNLIDNAVKYTPARGHVWVVAESRGDLLRIEVRDDGPGIAPKDRERIFERFYRVDPGRSRDMGGTGLGLSIVKHLVETMHGAIGVDENRPRGSVFWVCLRVARDGATTGVGPGDDALLSSGEAPLDHPETAPSAS